MLDFDFYNPTRICFGEGRIAQLQAHGMTSLGEHSNVDLNISRQALEACL
ncbi:MAG: hypothetical protein WCC36_06345 [Gammaproteobacteria bacterium]